ncbi:DnaJ C-terminal domain-containing protein [Exiguobacterium antarcticum]|uniref:DnaJ domain-containing protein n=1 Tax=Exiguobacterium antarcticum TaxID=132920 RepID=A0ABT6R3R3_9BACL|nr:DnaJ C-terminal domain-containing protein [Exiguobacterium antarcticum]AFS69605.1 Heat shock protein DnaJ domain protein [Exiguobacterium antarcticum B7]MDI3234941.1 DnaJ domain-containing protein [Exiguobacterium antarcticum]
MAKDYYRTLGVEKSASNQEIKRAYRKLAKQFHPDVNQEASADQRFKDIQEAFDVLGDEEKRAQYDQYGSDFERVAGAGYGQSADYDDLFRQFNGRQSRPSGSAGQSFGFEDMFGSFFSQEEEATDEELELTVPLSHLSTNEKVTIRLATGAIQMSLPKDLYDGKKVRLRGKSSMRNRKGIAGDVYVTIHLKDDDRFRRHETDVISTVRVYPTTFVLGGEVVADTLEGKRVKLKIKPGTKPGSRLRIPNRGLSNREGHRGALLVQLEVKLPEMDAAFYEEWENRLSVKE